ncbi:MAG: SMP-30/gluconolactonase/LRE family protein, partial [Planctomycetota bacterium]|nr:SMP-30/gluconolactonase/LRE family protein [Planctomycetota bacterium]
DRGGKFGRVKMKQSSVPLYWSCDTDGCKQDYVPAAFAEAQYLINFANLKAHTGSGVTLCAKNHYGSLVRWPVEKGYYDLHPSAFTKETAIYRNLVDLVGHSHLGGKTMLYLIDGLYCGVHPIDMSKGPRRWKSHPFNGDWTSSLFASQDPVAIDSVGFDFLHAEYEDAPRKVGVDDFLHEAALADNPPSGTFYDPDHRGNVKRLASLGVHEHWNNPKDKKYSRNLGTGKGIELVAVKNLPAEEFPNELVDFAAYEAGPLFAGTGKDTWDRDIRERGYILREGNSYHLWYTGYNQQGSDTKYLGYATSPDGLKWTRHSGNPVFDKSWVEDMCVVKHGDTYYMFAEGRNDIAHMLTSTDKIHWRDHGSLDIRCATGKPLSPGPYGTPVIWIEGQTWYLFYERHDEGIWLATSTDRKVWTNVRDDPVIAKGPQPYDQHAVALNQIIKHKGRYYAYYHATAHRPWRDWTTNVAVSTDLVHWKKYPKNPIVTGNKSSGIMVDDGIRYRLYTMHPDMRVYFPRGSKAQRLSVAAPGARVEKLSGGFKFTEGPAVDARGNVYFTDQPNNRIHKWSLDGKLSVFHESPGRANGLYFDKKGNLLACADLNNELWSIDTKGKVTVLVKNYRGKKLNGPNDLWMDTKSGIYFTDPFYKRLYWDRGPMEQDGKHVYYLKPGYEELIRVTNDLVTPNGIIGTPDGKRLYVADLGDKKTYVYDINSDATLSNKTLFCSMGSDGMTIDNEGNVYLTGRGVTVFDPAGWKIEHIPVDAGWTANVCFGGADRRTLFITAQKSLFALRMRVKGVQ